MVTIIHNVRSLHNVGSIFRTSDGAGIEKIYLTGYTPSPLDRLGKKVPQFAKVSLGAEDYVPWERVRDIGMLIARLKKDGCKIFAIEQDPHSIPYHSLVASRYSLGKLALVVGPEVTGLSKAVLKKCDKILEIPMYGKKESLNVSVAYGVVVYNLAVNATRR